MQEKSQRRIEKLDGISEDILKDSEVDVQILPMIIL